MTPLVHHLEDVLAPDRLGRARAFARLLYATVWVLEGLVPKLLVVKPEELDLVDRSGMVIVSPAFTLAFLGVCQIAGGLWLASGAAERLALGISIVALCFFTAAALTLDPMSVADPYGGIVKNLGLLAAAALLWTLADPERKVVA